MSKSYRLVALFARWSNDYWEELNDGSPQAEAMDTGPDGYEHVLSAAFDHPPSKEDTTAALRVSEIELANQDGKSQLLEYAMMDEDIWWTFLGQEARWFKEDEDVEAATIHQHGSLEAAQKEGARSGATFTTVIAS